MNEEKFSGRAELYALSRPSYAQGAIDLIGGMVPRGGVIADIGAGTGIFTRQLLSAGYRVYAVEPNADMRVMLSDCGAEVVCAPAEATGLPDNSVNLVTAAQAFHWFDKEKFRDECRRILCVGGRVLLVWNSEDRSSPLKCELNEISRRYNENFEVRPEFHETVADFFSEYTEYTFPNDLEFDREHFIANRLSRSHAPRQGEDNYDPFRAALSGLFDRYSRNGTITVPNTTRCYLGTV